MSPIRALFVIPRSDRPGAMSFVVRLAEAVRAEGAEVECFYVRTSFKPWIFFPQGWHIRKLARSGSFDIVNSQYGTYTGLITQLFTVGTDVRRVATFRGSDLNPVPSENRLKWWLQHSCSQIAALFAEGVTGVSSQVVSRIWWKKRFVAVIPSSTDLDRFKIRDREECRKILNWPSDRAIGVFFAGNDAAVKRLDLAERIATDVEKRNSGVELLIVRSVPAEKMPVYLSAADCLLFLSDFEGSPNLVREACASGLPIVSVDVGDVREILEGIDGCAIVDREMGVIEKAFVETCARRRRTRGREMVLQFGNAPTARKLLAFYSRLQEEESQRRNLNANAHL